MANSETIKAAIDANINTNGNQEITGAVMNSVLKQMVDSTDAQLAKLSSEIGYYKQNCITKSGVQENLVVMPIGFNLHPHVSVKFVNAKNIKGGTSFGIIYHDLQDIYMTQRKIYSGEDIVFDADIINTYPLYIVMHNGDDSGEVDVIVEYSAYGKIRNNEILIEKNNDETLSLIEKKTGQVYVSPFMYNSDNIVLDEINKRVVLKSSGFQIQKDSIVKVFSGGEDIVLSYKSEDAANGAYVLDPKVFEIEGDISYDILRQYLKYTEKHTPEHNNFIKLFGVYYESLIYSGIFATTLIAQKHNADVEEIKNTILNTGELPLPNGYKINTFFVNAGTPHSSTKDRIYCNIAHGERFVVSLTSDIDSMAHGLVYALSDKGESLYMDDVYKNNKKEFVAPFNVIAIGIYTIEAQQSGFVTFSVTWGAEGITYSELIENAFTNPYSDISIESKSVEFCSLFKAECNADTYLFFTDPHLWHSDVKSIRRKEVFAEIKKYYANNPLSFVMSGGDWLTQDDTQDVACRKLGEIDAMMHSLFDKYLPIFGNHDNNYQGKINENSDSNTGRLSNAAMTNLWFRQFGKAYYHYETYLTSYYIMDDGIDSEIDMDDYRWEQLSWLASALVKNKKPHIVIAKHMYYYTNEVVAPLSRYVIDLCAAFNNRETITLNGTNYDFSNSEGRVEYMTVGHSHADFDLIDKNIPIIGTRTLANPIDTNVAVSFDMRFADYTNRKLYCIRVGEGNNRIINL